MHLLVENDCSIARRWLEYNKNVHQCVCVDVRAVCEYMICQVHVILLTHIVLAQEVSDRTVPDSSPVHLRDPPSNHLLQHTLCMHGQCSKEAWIEPGKVGN